MKVINILHGRFFQRNTGQGHCLAGVIQADTTLDEGYEYVARYTEGQLTLYTRAVSADEVLRKIRYHDLTVSCMLREPIWTATRDASFFTLRTLPLGAGAYLVYSARLAPFFTLPSIPLGDAFFDLNANGVTDIPAPFSTAGEAINSIIRAPIWPLTADDAAQRRYVSVEPTSTPLLDFQNRVKALFLQVKRDEITLDQAYDQIPGYHYMLNSILQDDIYSAYLLKAAEHAPLITLRITSAQDVATREQCMKALLSALVPDAN